jgi:hypothetical protein
LASLLTCFPLEIFDSLSLLAVSRMKTEKQAQSIDYLLLIIFYLFILYLLTKFGPDCLSRCAFHNRRAAHTPSTFCVFTAHKMTTTATFMPDFAGSGDLDSFSQALMCLLFRHLAVPLK